MGNEEQILCHDSLISLEILCVKSTFNGHKKNQNFEKRVFGCRQINFSNMRPNKRFYPTEDWHCRHYFQVKVSTLALRWCGVTKCKDTADLFNVSLKPGLAGVVMHSYAELTLKQTCSITKTCLSHLQAIAVDPAERDLRLLYPKTNGKN